MRICMMVRMTPSHQRGGVEDHTLMLARGLAARGHAVTILTTALSPGGTLPAPEERLAVHHLAGTLPGKLDGAWRNASGAALERLHAEERFDLLHSQGPAGFAAILDGVPRRLGIPVLVSCHGTFYDELVTRWRAGFSADLFRSGRNIAALAIVLKKFAWSEKRALRRAGGVIATSNEQEKILRRVYGLGRIHTVFNGMDTSAFTPGPPPAALAARLGLPSGSRVILCVARLIHDKGVQFAIQALPAILRAEPAARLLIVGDGNYRRPLETLAARLRLSGAVTFAGSVPLEELPGYFRLCDLFVNPTVQQNGYDLTMVEAMACEKTVVSSRIGSTPTLIEEGTDGLLVPPGNPAALASAVSELLPDDPRRSRIGAAARRKVLGRFTLDAMVDGTLRVYEELCGGSR